MNEINVKYILTKKQINFIENSIYLAKENGFEESNKSKDLFYKKINKGFLFLDFRLKYISHTYFGIKPKVYFKNLESWEIIREFNKHRYFYNIFRKGWSYTLCFDVINKNLIKIDLYGPDGFCQICGKDIKKDEYVCEDCKKILDTLPRFDDSFICPICKRIVFDSKNIVVHHISYNPEKTMVVCRSCHTKIHHDKNFHNELKPQDKMPIIKRKYKLVPCISCDHKVRVPINSNKDCGICSKCKRKSKEKIKYEKIKYDGNDTIYGGYFTTKKDWQSFKPIGYD